MDAWKWRTLESGLLEVDAGTGWSVIELPGPDAQTKATEAWLPSAKLHARAHGVPVSWVLAVIYAESGGNPTVRNACCAGLMALSLAVYKISEAQAFDPEINIELGTKTLGQYRAQGWDLPEVASMYNAGPKAGRPKPDLSDPWGMVENRPAVPWTGYIEKVVRAANWWRRRELGAEVPAPPPKPTASRKRSLLGPMLLLGTALYLLDRRAFLWWLTPGLPPPGPFG